MNVCVHFQLTQMLGREDGKQRLEVVVLVVLVIFVLVVLQPTVPVMGLFAMLFVASSVLTLRVITRHFVARLLG